MESISAPRSLLLAPESKGALGIAIQSIGFPGGMVRISHFRPYGDALPKGLSALPARQALEGVYRTFNFPFSPQRLQGGSIALGTMINRLDNLTGKSATLTCTRVQNEDYQEEFILQDN